ncbi:DUF342 domain-containing protein [Motilimonas pumila]|uniref:DUF342 domain-containing protein n=1 Tax=Motilimonas pumila TaxID=2303987 RepID=A0A418YAY8_9GAMM|nr:FapA family protein [Motilimonas pumila]RJG40134.1 DUF342 domain-containing protein [Motilimonas pumila]
MLSQSSFLLDKNNRDLFLQAADLDGEANTQQVRTLLAETEFKRFKLSQVGLAEVEKLIASIKAAVTAATEAGTVNADTSTPEANNILIAQRVDATLAIAISDDKMVAHATLTASWAGKSVTEEAVSAALEETGVVQGIISKNIQALVQTGRNSAPGQALKVPVAKGKPAENGKDTRFERLVETMRERVLKPKELEGGKVDMRDLGDIVTVSAGKPIMRKHDRTLGHDGFTVTGEVLEHTEGEELEFDAGKNTQISPKNAHYLVATATGMPIEIERGMIVDDVLVIKNVDVKYGNVNFDGSLIIEGDICEGMKVEATGDISVAGLIESAEVKAGGNIHVAKGIIGHQSEDEDHHYSCELYAGGKIDGVFAQYTQMEANDDIHFTSQLNHCDVTCYGRVSVMDEPQRRGLILGGHIRARQGVHCVNIGAEAGTRTEVEFIGELEAKQLELKVLQQDIDKSHDKLSEIIAVKLKLKVMPEGEKKQGIVQRLALNERHEQEKIKADEQLIVKVEEEIKAYLAEAKLVAKQVIYSGVKVNLAQAQMITQHRQQNSEIKMQEGELICHAN